MNASCGHDPVSEGERFFDDHCASEDELDRLRVQLAGCSVAAQGSTHDVAKKGDYEWSPSYQDVLDLRLQYDAAQKRVAELEEAGEALLVFATAYRSHPKRNTNDGLDQALQRWVALKGGAK